LGIGSTWCSRVLTAGALAFAAVTPLSAQRAREWQVQGVATVTADRYVGGGVGFGFRTNGRMRAAVAVSGGDLEGERALRPEVTASFHLNPYKQRGVSVYAGGGVAVVVTEDESREYILALIGVEARPGAGAGWFAEVGVGGGLRIALGFRIRQRSPRR